MDNYTCITVEQAQEIIDNGAAIADIRDPQSFAAGRIPGSVNLNNDNLHAYISQADLDKPLIVCCYHGISSMSAAQYLNHQGFETVYSLDGGFEAWSLRCTDRIER
ncbi:thiosulfate sulfurtransferase GlpE [Neptunomonas sp. XY-337]|uniref:thiosulfate sulfurtransferase GlpE n=1 Tax=Neptunomonas sp. XY-337 TaxID=2561897 RepID=UPI0010AA5D0A|nr:thiosulfate sulfurtransferase GlpE [Neptunomonas sp. XY-337]